MSCLSFVFVSLFAYFLQISSQYIGPTPGLAYSQGLGPSLGPAVNYYPGSECATYGGAGVGDVVVAGELPVLGSALVAGQVPVLGAVRFAGNLPAAGLVSIAGNCACGCGSPGPYYY